MKLADIAAEVGGALEGDGEIEIGGVSSLAEAISGDITFLANPRYASAVAATEASAVLVNDDWDTACPCAVIRVKSADRAFAKIAVKLSPPPISYSPGIHATAVISENATVGDRVHIGPFCVVQPGAIIGNDCVLVEGVYVGHDCVLGASCMLNAKVSLRERSRLGDRVIIHNGAVIGSDGFGYTPDANGAYQKVEQLGSVDIGDDVEIGANVTIDRARFGRTMIGTGVKIDNLVQVGHNVRIGEHTVLVAQCGLAGSARVGSHVQLGGQSAVIGHVNVADGTIVAGKAVVTKDTAAKQFLSGYPAIAHRKDMRNQAHIMKLPELKKRVAALEAEIEALKKDADG
jgi:UDP-3-O-[3-hydroxymyristoyl] glucosamine N-acyltransferase